VRVTRAEDVACYPGVMALTPFHPYRTRTQLPHYATCLCACSWQDIAFLPNVVAFLPTVRAVFYWRRAPAPEIGVGQREQTGVCYHCKPPLRHGVLPRATNKPVCRHRLRGTRMYAAARQAAYAYRRRVFAAALTSTWAVMNDAHGRARAVAIVATLTLAWYGSPHTLPLGMAVLPSTISHTRV